MAEQTPAPRGHREGFVARVSGIRWLRALLLHPIVARPGYWFATACGLVWGAILGRFHVSRQGGVIVAQKVPKWAFGRGGTTIGAVYLTSDNVTPGILQHEAVHRAQWKKYGLCFIPLYLAAGYADPELHIFDGRLTSCGLAH